MHATLIRNDVYNVLRVSLNRTTVTAYHMLYHVRFLCRNLFEDFEIHVHLSHRRLRRAVKISTRQIQMRSWLLKGMGAGTLIGLLHVTPKPHLQVNRLLQTNPF